MFFVSSLLCIILFQYLRNKISIWILKYRLDVLANFCVVWSLKSKCVIRFHFNWLVLLCDTEYTYLLLKCTIMFLKTRPTSNGGINLCSIMSKVNYSVTGCSNSTYKINKWKKETSTEHNFAAEGKGKENCLESKPPFHLHIFIASVKRSMDKSSKTRIIWRQRRLGTSCIWSSLFHSFCWWNGDW